MPNAFKTLINISVWLLFLKGLLAVLLTFYIVIGVLMRGAEIPMVAAVSCMAGSVAFISTCVAAWLRKKVE